MKKVLQTEEVRNEEDTEQDKPGWRATATDGERKEELSGEGHTAAGVGGLIDDDMDKGEGEAGGSQKSEPVPEGVEGDRVPSMPRQVPRRRLRHKFTRWQLEELERIFQANRFLSIEARKQLARWMGVSEVTVKVWFRKRRQQYRSYKRL